MVDNPLTMAQKVARAAIEFQQRLTGHAPKSVTVVLSESTLVITLHGALTPAEQMMASDAEGASKVQAFHRQLFASSSESMRREIKRITGVDVREAAAEVDPFTRSVVHAFTSGTMVHVYQLSDPVSAMEWAGGAREVGGGELRV